MENLNDYCAILMTYIEKEDETNTFLFLKNILKAQIETHSADPIDVIEPIKGDENLSKYFNNLNKWYSEHKTEIEEFFSSHGLESVPIVTRKKGNGRGKKTTYQINLRDIDEESKNYLDLHPKSDAPKGGITYTTTNNKRQFRLQLKGWRLAGVLSLLFLPYIGILGVIMILILQIKEYTPYLFEVSFAVGIFWLFSWPIQKLLSRGHVKAPFLFNPTFNENKILQIRSEPNKEFRTISTSTYKAECAICKGTIFLKKKGIPFLNRRIVGECRENPVMHQYSFDFVTRTGSNLNKYI